MRARWLQNRKTGDTAMSAFARLAIVTVKTPARQSAQPEDGPARDLEILAQAALKAAPPPPPPVISFAPEPHAPAGWFARLRTVLSV
jgi:hypothetical protein